MEKNILSFLEINDDDLNLVGGKGLNLGKLTKASFAVPDGFCVTTVPFEKLISKLREEGIFKELEQCDISNNNEIKKLSEEVRKQIIGIKLDSLLEAQVKESIDIIGSNSNYAVRSSATAEDLPEMSFAGQQDTYLNIKGYENIFDSIKKCWASLYTERAVIYRKKNNIDENDVLISVVVQKMVNSKKSGIMFTADPITNNYNHINIDAGFGLGESLVSGLITPDLYKYDKKKNKIIYKEVNKKDIAIYGMPEGKTVQEELVEKEKRVLSDNEITKLAEIAIGIEKYYGKPQDIEWAIDNEIYIVQSRPITSLYPKIINNRTGDRDKLYVSFNHIQVMTDAIRPLGIDMFRNVFPIAKDEVTGESKSILEAGGRVFIDITPVLQLPLGLDLYVKLLTNIDKLMADGVDKYIKIGIIKKKFPSKEFRNGIKTLVVPTLKGIVKKYKSKEKDNANMGINEFINSYTEMIESNVRSKESLEERLEEVKKISTESIKNILLNIGTNIGPGIISYKRLITLLNRLDIDITLADKVVSGLQGNITTEMGLMVGDLSDLVRRDKEAIEILKNDPKRGYERIIKGDSIELSNKMKEFIDVYGMRGIGEIDITRLRYREDFTPISVSILNNISVQRENEHREKYNKLIEQSKRAENEILTLCREKGKLKDYKKASNYIKNIRTYLSMREHGKYAIIRVFDVFRKIFDEGDHHLYTEGLIENRRDIDYLKISEIIYAVENKTSYKNVIKERKKDYRRYDNMIPPRVISSEGEIFQGSYSNSKAPKEALIGTPVSAGVYEGYARVILDPLRETLQRGEILVTKFTDPGWTPIFVNAKGLILEVGGLMTHGAIVAREYGIPAIVGLENATTLIKTGDYLRVNAIDGYVEILR